MVAQITGNVGTTLIGKDSFQEVYIAGITMPITKHNFVVREWRETAGTGFCAMHSASHRPAAVVLGRYPERRHRERVRV